VTGREFEALASHTGAEYLRYSFAKGTEQEVAFLAGALGLQAGMRLLDVGCGPGRHCHALSRLGMEVVGLDISHSFLVAAGSGRWVRADARELPFKPGGFDAAISLCQGGFGLLGGEDDGLVLEQIAQVVAKGGRIALTGFSSYFAVRFLEETDCFDAATGVNHEKVEVKGSEGRSGTFDLWTTCFTPRELRLMASAAGVEVLGLWSVRPGSYAERSPDLDHPELLLIGGV
jgi:SAM-dependent methyltransferase